MKLAELQSKTYWHASKSDLPMGKVISWKSKPNGTFGIYEKILEHFRPSSDPSRLRSFYLANSRQEAEQFVKGNVYQVKPIGKITTGYVGWIGLLLHIEPPHAFKEGDALKLTEVLKNPDIKYICDQYWAGTKPSAKDFKHFKNEPDAESYIQETLVAKIICLKHFD